MAREAAAEGEGLVVWVVLGVRVDRGPGAVGAAQAVGLVGVGGMRVPLRQTERVTHTHRERERERERDRETERQSRSAYQREVL